MSPIEKIHLPPSQVLCLDLLCKTGLGCMLDFLLLLWCFTPSQLLSSPCFPWRFEGIGRKLCEGCKRDFIWNVILWKKCIWIFFVLATTSGFLTGSFPMEPWTGMNNRERKKDYENLLALLLCDFRFCIYMWENRMIDKVFNYEFPSFNYVNEKQFDMWKFLIRCLSIRRKQNFLSLLVKFHNVQNQFD